MIREPGWHTMAFRRGGQLASKSAPLTIRFFLSGCRPRPPPARPLPRTARSPPFCDIHEAGPDEDGAEGGTAHQLERVSVAWPSVMPVKWPWPFSHPIITVTNLQPTLAHREHGLERMGQR